MKLPYNIESKQSIIRYAKLLVNSTLKKSCDKDILKNELSGKGKFGQILEKYYFLYDPNSKAEADFPAAQLELKSSPLKQLKNNNYKAKERLVLNIINYLEIVNQNFETSSFWEKNSCLLLVFYLYEKDKNILDYLIKLVDQWNFPKTDLEIIKKDWEFITNKVKNGKAHEISEGDTFYLGACTKGANSKSTRQQPFNEKFAKQRAYSLKQGYVNHIIASIAENKSENYGKLIHSSSLVKKKTIEEIVISKFKPYYNKNTNQILKKTSAILNKNAKNFIANLSKSILGVELDKKIEEFEKADIIVKTVRLKESDLPKESISFRNFHFTKIVNQEWDDSDFKNILEHKFLFVFFKYKGSELILKKVKFWNMPYNDLLEAERVWIKNREIISKGEIVNEIKHNRRFTNFTGKKFSYVAHVRPHANLTANTFPLPVPDKLTKAKEYTKHCFWLNDSYVRDEIYLK